LIYYIKGYVTETMPGKLVIENNGVGYLVNVTDNCSALLAGSNDMVTLYTFMAVREDDISLFGFADKESLNMFNLLTTVSGIGNKGALAILSKLSPYELRQAIVFEDADSIAKANGIGKKTAAKVVLELKDKVGSIDLSNGTTQTAVQIVKGSAKDEAVLALTSLGFSKTEAMSRLVGVNDDSYTAEDYVKIALKNGR